MKKTLLAGLLVLPCAAWAQNAWKPTMSGDYVEVRTASVFAGPCHFNGEVITTGRDALMAWNVQSGEWRGTSL